MEVTGPSSGFKIGLQKKWLLVGWVDKGSTPWLTGKGTWYLWWRNVGKGTYRFWYFAYQSALNSASIKFGYR